MSKLKKTLKDDLWVILLDIIAVNVSYYLALVLRMLIDKLNYQGAGNVSSFFEYFYKFAPIYTLACLIVFALFRLYGGIWRYAGINDINRVVAASVVTCIIQVIGSTLLINDDTFKHMPITYYGIGAVLQFVFVSAIRFSYRFFVIEKRRANRKPGRAVVVGMGELGKQTMRSLQEGVYYKVCGIIDPNDATTGKLIDGIPVYNKNQISELIEKNEITCVFLADPNLNEKSRQSIKTACKEKKTEIRDYSHFFDFVGETDQSTVIRSVTKSSQEQNGKRQIPFSPPDISESEIGEVVEALKSGWITTGPRTKLLERRLAAYIETGKTDVDTESEVDHWKERVVCLNSATAGEELNLKILGIRPGDEVIVPAYTYTASASAAIHCGAKVVFVDIQKDGDPKTHCPEMDYDALEAAITEKTKAVIPVDLGGIVCDYDKIYEIVDKKRSLFTPLESDGTPLNDLASRIQHAIGRVAIVCDAAHALGASRTVSRAGNNALATPERRYVGAIADFTSFSFHAVKNFTTAEGGASTWLPLAGVSNAEIYKMFQLLSLHGQNKDALAKTKIGAWEYDIIGPWYKCNMTDIMAAIGLRQLDRYPKLLQRRENMMKKYDAVCDELGISHMVHHTENTDSSNHLYLIRVPGIGEAERNKIIEKMAERGVATNVHYKPLPMMTAYGKDCSVYPNSYDYYHNLITLPFHTLLSDADVDYVCKTLKEVMNEVRAC